LTTAQPEPFESEGVARAAQVAAMSLTVLEALCRLRAERLAQRAHQDELGAASAGAQLMADHAHARVGWSQALDEAWLSKANTGALARAWAAATPWSETDVDARAAMDRVEQQLHIRHPEAMAAYQSARAAGLNAGEAMAQAAPLFQRPLAIESAAKANGLNTPKAPDARSPLDLAADAYPYSTDLALDHALHNNHGAHLITTARARGQQR
jgi:hypothetical protein